MLALLLLATAAAAARAQPTLELASPASCPQAEDVLAEVASIVGAERMAASNLRAQASLGGPPWRFRVTIEGAEPRSHDVASCEMGARYIATILATAIGPALDADQRANGSAGADDATDNETGDGESPDEQTGNEAAEGGAAREDTAGDATEADLDPEPDDADANARPDDTSANAQVNARSDHTNAESGAANGASANAGDAEPGDAADNFGGSSAETRQNVLQDRAPRGWALGADVVVDGGSLPAAAGGLRLELVHWGRRLRLAAGALVAYPRSANAEAGSARLGLGTVHVAAGIHRAYGALSLDGSALVELGALGGRGQGDVASSLGLGFWWSAGLSGAVALVTGAWRVRLGLDALAVIHRPRFVIDPGGVVHRANSLVIRGFLGTSVVF